MLTSNDSQQINGDFDTICQIFLFHPCKKIRLFTETKQQLLGLGRIFSMMKIG